MPTHDMETVTPIDNMLLVDCSCGRELWVPQGGDEGGSIDAVMAAHRRMAAHHIG